MPGYMTAVAERFGIEEQVKPPSAPLPLNHVDRKNEGEELSEILKTHLSILPSVRQIRSESLVIFVVILLANEFN